MATGLPNVHAQLRPSPLVKDGMVLQRHANVPLWGWADAKDTVTVTFEGQTFTDQAGSSGRWQVTLPARQAGGPHELTLRTHEDTVHIEDILIGDVWVCSGQSNMEWTVADAKDAKQEIAAAQDSLIRHFKVPRSWAPTPTSRLAGGTWEPALSKYVGDFTAVGYFFARELRAEVDVPVGLINTSWGGSRIEPWMSAQALGLFSGTADAHVQHRRSRALQALKQRQSEEALFVNMNHVPTFLYNKMIHPLLPFPITGVLWYQGEANATAEDAYGYRHHFTELIRSWREAWDRGTFPFLYVQLANFVPGSQPYDGTWALLRESQSAALALPNTAQAVTIDIGNPDDIHPRNKQDVGRRLSLAARALEYGDTVVYSGPTYQSYRVDKDRVILRFDHVGGGLVANGSELRGFTIAGADRHFVPAEATIDGNRIIVSSEQVDTPVAVRYAWSDNPEHANLYNQEGLPASPFRTDSWDIPTERTSP